MALTLDATVGGASSNSYLDRTAADSIMEENPHASATWIALTDAVKDVNLVRATRVIDAEFDWLGYRANLTVTQSLEWPRGGVYVRDRGTIATNIIPIEIQRATSEYAYYLSQQSAQPETTAGLKSIKLPAVELHYKELQISDTPEIPTYIQRWVQKFITSTATLGGATVAASRA